MTDHAQRHPGRRWRILLGRYDGIEQTALNERQAHWDRKNDLWLAHYTNAARFYRELLALEQGPLTVLGLVEDGAL
jgi:hypothetical protein